MLAAKILGKEVQKTHITAQTTGSSARSCATTFRTAFTLIRNNEERRWGLVLASPEITYNGRRDMVGMELEGVDNAGIR